MNRRETGTSSIATICQLVHGLSVGGAEILAAGLARRFQDVFRFLFVCLDELGSLGQQLRVDGFPVWVLRRQPGVDWRCSWRLARLLQRERVDLLHVHQYTPFFYAMTARVLCRRPPVLFTEHGRWYPDYPRRSASLRIAFCWNGRPGRRRGAGGTASAD